ncbi:MAG TPA: hypothetical protein PKM21_15940 [Anaerolineales bacterium]|nr:hypothetical protein [Anaerolineales bacterium]
MNAAPLYNTCARLDDQRPMPSLATTIKRLRAAKLEPVEKVIYRLSDVHHLVNMQLIAQELDVQIPDLHLNDAAGQGANLRDSVSSIFLEMANKFPINDFWVESFVYEDEFPPRGIPIALLNLASNWDEFSDIVCNPEWISEDRASAAFALWLLHEVANDYWGPAADHFGWPVRRVPRRIRRSHHLDHKMLLASLDEAGLSDFKAAFQMGMFDTGSRFLDLDDQILERTPPDFSLAEMHALIAESAIADRVLDQIKAASNQGRREPQIYKKLMDLYASAST